MNNFTMAEELFFRNLHIPTVDILFCGTQKCDPGYSYGPYIRAYTIMVYIHKGKGIFRTHNTLYRLSAGSTFFIFEGEVTFYQADEQDPWEYYWIGFKNKNDIYDIHGLLLKNSISVKAPVCVTEKDTRLSELYHEIINLSNDDHDATKIKVVSLFFDIIYIYLTNTDVLNSNIEMYSDTKGHMSLAIEYIKSYYNNSNISVSSLADYLDISREHTYVLFKKHFNISPIKFITIYRLQMAGILLQTTNHSIADIANETGFADYNYFATVFKKHFEMSPGNYRRLIKECS